MWLVCLILSLSCLAASGILCVVLSLLRKGKGVKVFRVLFAGAVGAALFLFLPIHSGAAGNAVWGCTKPLLLTLLNTMQLFTMGAEFSLMTDAVSACPVWFADYYLLWAAILYVIAPVFTFGFVLSLFRNMTAWLKYLACYHREVYIFSNLTPESATLAKDLRSKNKKAVMVFNNVSRDDREAPCELMEQAEALNAVCFQKDILAVNYHCHSKKKKMWFFTIGKNEADNLDDALRLIERYRHRKHTNLYVFSTETESELLLTAVDKGSIRVRRVNAIRSFINLTLYERGHILFDTALPNDAGRKTISAVVVGMGDHGTEMLKALTWYCQMDGYDIEINAFDKDALAEDRFKALAPELMSEEHNHKKNPGDAQYDVTIHSGCHVETASFADKISRLTKATYVFISLGNDDFNVKTAVDLRMRFARLGIYPVIHAVVKSSRQKKALADIKNFRGQAYHIDFIGDLESTYTGDVVLDSGLEPDTVGIHRAWGSEETVWTYEYNYRSSVAAAIHNKAKRHCGIPGAGGEELTDSRRGTIEALEHRRWLAYMRSEGYVFSGSEDRSSRNDLAKMHHNLVPYEKLIEEDKRKDSRVATGS